MTDIAAAAAGVRRQPRALDRIDDAGTRGAWPRHRAAALVPLGMTTMIGVFVYPLAWPTHIQWAAMLLMWLCRGAGQLSLDPIVWQRIRRPAANPLPAAEDEQSPGQPVLGNRPAELRISRRRNNAGGRVSVVLQKELE
jgi:hypothetical protein